MHAGNRGIPHARLGSHGHAATLFFPLKTACVGRKISTGTPRAISVGMLHANSFRSHPTTLFSRERRKQRLDAFLDAFNRQPQPTSEVIAPAPDRLRATRQPSPSGVTTAGR
jgi:hypothetical protein